MFPARSLLVDRGVAAAFLLQVVGYAALLAVYPHSEPSAVVGVLRSVPTVILVVLALPAIPALVLTLGVGAFLSLVGMPPQSMPALLLARGDAVFFASALVVAVGAAWANRRAKELTSRFDGAS